MTSVVSNRWHEVIKAVLSSNVTQLSWKCELHPLISSMNTWSKCTARDIDKVVAERIVFCEFLYFCIFCIFVFFCILFFYFDKVVTERMADTNCLKLWNIWKYLMKELTWLNWHLSFNTCLYLEEVIWTRYFRKNIPPVCLDIFCEVIPELSIGGRSDTFCHQNKTNCMLLDLIFWMTEVH